MSREAFGDPPDPEPQFCPVCDQEWHTEDCILGQEVARRLKAERDLAGWREMALSQAGDAGLLARAMKAETEAALLSGEVDRLSAELGKASAWAVSALKLLDRLDTDADESAQVLELVKTGEVLALTTLANSKRHNARLSRQGGADEA